MQKSLKNKKVKKMKKIVLIFIFICTVFCITNLAYAKNLGVWGSLFPIEEQDIREFIYQRLNEMEQNGEMTFLNKKFAENVKEHTLRPTPVAGLATTKESKIFYYDPTYILTRNIEDHERNVIAKKGTVINPLDTITLHGVMFFLDADDKKQIKWALENAKKHDYVKYILVKGNIKEAGKKLNDRIYFDQYGSISHKLGIHHIPCIVKQEGKKLQVQEFAIEEDSSKQDKVLVR